MADLKLLRFVPTADVDPTLINYRNGLPVRLRRVVRDPVLGEVHRIDYFDPESDYDPNAAAEDNDLVLKEEFAYTRDTSEMKLVTERTLSISYFDEDGNISIVKPWVKHYSARQAIAEGKRRRDNILTDLEAKIGGLLLATGQSVDLGRDFVTANSDSVLAYREVAAKDLWDVIVNATEPWINTVVDLGQGPVTIKVIMLLAVNIWGFALP